MCEVEEGPNRRLSRGRKRTSHAYDEDIGVTEKSGRCLRSARQSTETDWSSSSFQSTKPNITSQRKQAPKCHSSTTPKAKRSRRISKETDPMNTSDSFLADLDIDTITSQALSQFQAPKGPVGTGSDKENQQSVDGQGKIGVMNESITDGSICSGSTQSQYFGNKFGNYHSTQPLNRREVIVENAGLSGLRKCDSSFSFSFVGDDTQVDNAEPCETDTSSLHIVTVGPKDTNCNNKLVSNTQIKTEPRGHKFRCTPYFKTADLSVSVIETQDLPLVENGTQSQYCEPEGTQPLGTVLDTTQLKDCEGFKYRCTPYKMKANDSGTQAQTQSQLMAGTQYQSYLHESCKDSGSQLRHILQEKHSQNIEEESSQGPQDSQIPCTGLCDMTGVIVDSQSKDTGLNTSDSDLFSDSICDDRSQRDVCSSGRTGGKDVNILSHTQALKDAVGRESAEKRRDSFDDDIECIMQESQHRLARSKQEENRQCTSDSAPIHKKNTHQNTFSSKFTRESELVKKGNEDEAKTLHAGSHVKEDSLSYGEKTKYGMKDNVVPKLPTTPAGAGSLQDRIKQRLKDNAGRRTPQGPGVLMEQLREQVMERVNLEAKLLKEKTSHDIGPFYGLPKKVKDLFENYRGIKDLYDWQDECLKLPAIQQRKNLIYSLPTSGGKTLVAEILILQEILCNKRDALLILPFVSIVQEKVRNMSQFAVDLSFYVEEYAGSKGRFPPINRRTNRSLYIATIEKAQSIVNSLIEMDRMDNLGLVVVDELHMLGEGGSRGSTLEATLMKILHSSSPTQIIGMSATLNNIEDLQTFLNADIYSNDFRPVTLTEHVKLTESVYRVDQKAKCPDDQLVHDRIVCFQYPPEMAKTDPDHLLGLALEVIPDNSCLVFCPTKKNCENVALMLSKLIAKYKRELSEVKKGERRGLLKELNNDAEGKICPVLQYTLHFGIAYHHSGLTVDERKLIEEAYSDGTLCLLACTSTLAAGVNLPAKRVILRSPYVGQYFLSRSQYKQMVGRAGRAGIDSSGESVLICKPTDRTRVHELLVGPIESCHSSLLYNEAKGVRTLILSTIGLKITTSTEDVFRFLSRSLARCQESVLNVDMSEVCRECLQKLVDSGLVTQLKSQSEDPEQPNQCHSLEVTRLGKATFKGPIDPDYAGMLYKDLKKGEEPLVVSNHLHLLYLVTPYDAVKAVSPSWFIYFNQMNVLQSSELKVASLIGVPESYIARKATQQKTRQKVDEFVVSRFYLTLMLYDLWREKSVWEVAEKFQQPRGFIQNLLSSAASFASCVAHFCQELEEFWAYQDLLGNFVKRLSYCVASELIPLMEIPGVKLGRARLMYAAGYKSLSGVASANPEDLVKSVQYMPRKAARQIVASAKLLLSEKAEAMMEQVESLVTVPTVTNGNVAMTTVATPAPVTPGLSQDSQFSESDPKLNT